MSANEKSPQVLEHQTDCKGIDSAKSIAYHAKTEKLSITMEPNPEPVLIDCFIGAVADFIKRIQNNRKAQERGLSL